MSTPPKDQLTIRILSEPDDESIEIIRTLFREYADALGVDLSFQDFESEMAGLPGEYARPGGTILLALRDDLPAGCVAMRKLSPTVCEMKRLYVRPDYRRDGVGALLVIHLIEEARRMGYERMRLDTLPSMAAARALYERLGFRPIPPYRHNPIPGTAFLELDMTRQEEDA